MNGSERVRLCRACGEAVPAPARACPRCGARRRPAAGPAAAVAAVALAAAVAAILILRGDVPLPFRREAGPAGRPSDAPSASAPRDRPPTPDPAAAGDQSGAVRDLAGAVKGLPPDAPGLASEPTRDPDFRPPMPGGLIEIATASGRIVKGRLVRLGSEDLEIEIPQGRITYGRAQLDPFTRAALFRADHDAMRQAMAGTEPPPGAAEPPAGGAAETFFRVFTEKGTPDDRGRQGE